MLVLTRRVGEKVVVEHADELLEVEVQLMGGGQVKLGFVGPRAFRVFRAEVLERMQSGARARKRAARGAKSSDAA